MKTERQLAMGLSNGQDEEELGHDNHTKEALHLLSLLPVEVWLQVIQKLPPAGLLNASSAARILDQFSHVFKTEMFLELLFANVFPYLEKKDVFSLRLVCSSWTKGVDKFFESLSHSGGKSGGRSSRCAYTSLERFSKKFHPRNAQAFMETMSNHCGNPFPTRSIWLSELGPGCFRIVKKFGCFLNHARIHVAGNDLEVLEYLRICLIRLPNITSLNLVLFLHTPTPVDATENFLFPELPRLTRVKLSWLRMRLGGINDTRESCSIPLTFFNTLAANYSRQLTSFELLPLRSSKTFPLGNYSYPALSQLAISVSSWLDLESLISLRNSPLETLSLSISSNHMCQNMDSIFGILYLFNETLTQLELSLPLSEFGESCPLPVMEFPKLNKLHVKAGHIGSIDFVSQLKNLTSLAIHSFSGDFNELKSSSLELIKYSKLMKSKDEPPLMYLSNIWHVLPNLENLEICIQDTSGLYPVKKAKFIRSNWTSSNGN